MPMTQQKISNSIRNVKPLPYSMPKKYSTGSSNDVTIAQMGLSVRSYNSLNRAGLRTASVICAKSDAELLKVRNLSMHGVKEIRQWQASHESEIAQTFAGSDVNSPLAKTTMSAVNRRANATSKSNHSKPATLNHLPKKVHSKLFGSGVIIELTSSKGGTKIKILFENGVEKTFNERIALQSGTICYEY